MRILIVCTGNLCRSPIAEHLFRRALAARFGVSEDQLAGRGWIVESAGTHAVDGLDMPENAKRALAEQGGRAVRHRARALVREMLMKADAIYPVAREHLDLILSFAPDVKPKVRLLDPEQDIDDPMGLTPEDYRASARQIARAVEAVVKEL